MQIFPSFFLLVLLFYGIKAGPNENTTRQLEYNLGIPDESTITCANTVDDNQPRFNEVSNVTVKKLAPLDNNKKNSHQHQRRSRDAESRHGTIKCISCMNAGFSTSYNSCYTGVLLNTIVCADGEACFTELHPQYIKRGCILPSKVNRTFVCKCPLCNDKPVRDAAYYDYTTISDWQFDNERLEEPMLGMELFCKICQTSGHNHGADKSCSNGSMVDYVLCGHNQLCYTNFNRYLDYVSRGCIDSPAFNSIYFFCNSSSCNSAKYENPALMQRTLQMNTRSEKGANGKTMKLKSRNFPKNKSFATIMTITTKEILIVLHFSYFIAQLF